MQVLREGGLNMNKHYKKMIAPVIITILVLIFLIVYGTGVMAAAEVSPLFLFLVLPIALLGAGMVIVLIARIKEIKDGEEDDLSNY